MPRHFKLDQILNEADQPAYEAMLREGAKYTIDDLFEWLVDRGYAISRSAVGNHKKNFEEKLDSVRRAAEMATMYTEVAKQGDAATISDSSFVRFQQLMMEYLFSVENGEDIPPAEFAKIAKALKDGMSGLKTREGIRAEYERRQQQALDQAEDMANEGASGEEVVRKVREILGVAA